MTSKLPVLRDIETPSEIKVGMVGVFGGKRYEVIGALYLKGSYDEFDDYYDKYVYGGGYAFIEWVLECLDGEGEELYIVDEGLKYHLGKRWKSAEPINGEKIKNEFRVLPEHSFGYADTLGEEESTRVIGETEEKVGTKFKYVEYEKGQDVFGAEWVATTPDDVYFYHEKQIPRGEIYGAFGMQDKIQKWENADVAAKAKRKEMYTWFGLSVLVAAVVGFMGVAGVLKEKEVYASFQSFTSPIIPQETTFGPIELKEKKNYALEAVAPSVMNNDVMSLAIEILDVKQTPVSEGEQELWHESGYDSEGSWSESKTSGRYLFKLTEPGTYYVRIVNQSNKPYQKIGLRVVANPMRLYYFFAFIFAVVAAGGFLVAARTSKVN